MVGRFISLRAILVTSKYNTANRRGGWQYYTRVLAKREGEFMRPGIAVAAWDQAPAAGKALPGRVAFFR